MKRTDIINTLIKSISAKDYLEIGVYDGKNFDQIECENKIGVDPDTNSPATYHLTSDAYFELNRYKSKRTFDVIFIDGLHTSEQVAKDIGNSLEILNENGYIVCHDINPTSESLQIVPYAGGLWNGDVWKAFVTLRGCRPDLEMFTVNTDWGCGVITRGGQDLIGLPEELTYAGLEKNRKLWLNLISVEEFLNMYNVEYSLNELLNDYIMDPSNAENNFSLGLYYDGIGQTATAVSYYLRTAERSNDDLLKYECLIKASICFDKQGSRNFTVKGLLQHAISLCPKRPEAYYLMSKFHEKENKDGSWNDCYMITSIANNVCDFDCSPLRTEVNYPGKYAITFQNALSSWWCGLCEESRNLFLKLKDNPELDEVHKVSVMNNLKHLNVL